ncbi:MAG TPA: PAS domain S-box protein [Gemmataceae bacterium]|nr:PAS domain S-box protein [Gemmataceae bacterium]
MVLVACGAILADVLIVSNRRAADRLRLLTDTAPVFLIHFDAAQRFRFVSEGYARCFGLSREDVVGKSIREVVGQEAYERLAPYLDSALAGKALEFEVELPYPSGATRRSRRVYVPEVDASGKVRGVVGTITDLTQMDVLYQAARETADRFRCVVEAAPDAIITIDDHGIVETVNPAVRQVFGYEPGEVIGQSVGVLMPEPYRSEHDGYIANYLRTGVARAVGCASEVPGRRKDGTTIPLDRTITETWLKGRRIFCGIVRDITERKRAQEALRESEERFRAAFDQAAVGMAQVGLDGRWLRVNRKLCEIVGYTPEELQALTIRDITHPEDLPVGLEVTRRQLAGEIGAQTREKRYLRKDGSPVWVNLTVSVVRGESGAGDPLYFMAVIEEITARRAVGQALRDTEARFHQLADAMPQIVWTARPNGHVDYYNQRWYEFTGFPEGETGDQSWIPILHPDDVPRCVEAWYAAVRTAQPVEIEARFQDRRSGGCRWHQVRAQPALDDGGRVVRWYGVCTDIDDYKRAEEEIHRLNEGLERCVAERTAELQAANQELSAIRERFELATRAHAGGLWDWNLDTDEVYYSPTWKSMLGYEAPEMRARLQDWEQLLHPDDRERALQELRALREQHNGQPEHFVLEVRMRHRDGTYRWISTRGVTLCGPDGRPHRMAGSHTDVTDLKRIQEELRQAKEAAESANRAKSEFLANMSHEIRTPMNGVLGMTELTLDTELTPEQRENLEVAQDSAEALLTVLDDILDFSKVEAGKLDIHPAAFRPREAVQDTIRLLAHRAHTHGLKLACQVDSAVLEWLVGDAGRLRQVITNLMGNAIKFTERGGIDLRISVDAQADDEVCLHFTVSDTGIGIPADKLQGIFAPFVQVDSSTTRKYGGTGLGLAICAKLVELMRGRIWAESEVGRGSTFHFTARLGRCANPCPADEPATTEALRGLPVLVVDDNATSRDILQVMLEGWGMGSTAVGTGPDALAALGEAAARGDPFRLVLLDGQMPEMDGFAVAEKIAHSPEAGGPVVLMLSSGDLREDAARCRTLGISQPLIKPIKESELLGAVLAALGAGGHPGERRQQDTRPAPPHRPLRILLAEDSPLNQKVSLRMLEREGHTVTLAGNGREALAALDKGTFDLVLMDVQMPEMDGLEATRVLREGERATGRHVPVIAMTAHALNGDRHRCLAAGMDGYISKPIRQARLRETLSALRDSLPPEAPGPEVPSLAVAAAGVFDREAALAGVEGDEAFLREMAAGLLQDCPALLEAIRSAVSAGDASRLARAAHALKGDVAHFRGKEVFEAVGRLEQLGSAGDLGAVAGACTAAEAQVRGLCRALTEFLAQPLVASVPESPRCGTVS